MSMCDYCLISKKCVRPAWFKGCVIRDKMYCESAKLRRMSIISMAYVTPSFCNLRKSVTRRNWTPQYAKQFKKGDTLKVYSKSPQWKGEPIGIMKLTETPYREKTGVRIDNVDGFYEAEGFQYLDEQYSSIMQTPSPLYDITVRWINNDTEHWVVPFEIIEVFPEMKDKFNQKEEIVRCVNKLIEVIE